jgi:hypothetical protein
VGPRGPSTVYGADTPQYNIGGNPGEVTIISKDVPAGTYAVNVKMWAWNTASSDPAYLSCALRQSGNIVDIGDSYVGGQQWYSVALQGIVPNYPGGALTVTCKESGPSNYTWVEDVKLSAIKVDSNG